jgi:thiol-disulfide isomerase/thioredoxin
MQLFAKAPKVIAIAESTKIPTYNWKLKDENWDFFDFKRSEGKLVILEFWASWRLPSLPELKTLQSLYNDYQNEIDFYFITDENREPVEEFMNKNHFSFPVTYLIIGEPTPVLVNEPPRSYLIDQQGNVLISQHGTTNWNSETVRNLLDSLIQKK